MVRAGVVAHPSEWNLGGYNEIQKSRQRYALLGYKRLMDLLYISTVDDLRDCRKSIFPSFLINLHVVISSSYEHKNQRYRVFRQSLKVWQLEVRILSRVYKRNSAFGQKAVRLKEREVYIIFVKLRLLTIAILPLKMVF